MVFQNSIEHLPTNCDVLIIGGGAAGVAAAVGAMQNGASVIMIEKNGYPGGKATSAFVGTICGIYYTSSNLNPEFVVAGFPKLFCEKLLLASASTPVFQKPGLHFFPYNRQAFISLCNEYVQHSKLFFHSYAENIVLHNNKIHEVQLIIHNHTASIYPKTVIDCTGEAIVSSLTNQPQIISTQYQAAAQVFSLAGLPAEDSGSFNLSLARAVKKGLDNSTLPAKYARISIVPGTIKNGSALFKLGIPLNVDNSQHGVAAIEIFAKEAVTEIAAFLKNNSDLFSNSYVEYVAPEAGIRTGPCSVGKYILSEDDVLSCRKFEDAIARGSWPVEFWEPGKTVMMQYFEENNYYEIPSGCLTSPTIDNLFFAGRTISATEKAIASARVIGTCLQTGFAAGMLASGFAFGKPQQETVASIQAELFN